MSSIFDNVWAETPAPSPDQAENAPVKKREWVVALVTSLWQRLLKADEQSANNRAAIQALFDNAPPFIEGSRRNEGLEFLANFNPGDARAALNAAISPYVEMMKSTEYPLRIKTNWGAEGSRSEIERIMSEEWGRIVRGWPYWNTNFLHLSNLFVGHGVGIAYFLDDKNWQFRVSGMADFKIPRMSYANENEIEVSMCARPYLPHQLRSYITKKVVDPAWNVKAVEKAVADAMAGGNLGADYNKELKPELAEAAMKNGDPTLSYATNTMIKCLHVWAREPDGTITQLITLEDGTNKDFLFKKTTRFENMGDAFVYYTLNVGINGYYHSIRGLGEQIYNLAMELARMECRASDNAKLASSLLFKSTTEGALTEAALSFIGPCGQLHKDAEIVAYEFPDATKTIFPVLNEQRSLLRNHIGQYAGPVSFNDSREETKYEVKARQGESASVSSTGSTLFYESHEKLLRQMLRRFIRPDYRQDEAGGIEVFEWIKRCMKRGVPLAAIQHIDISRCTVVRAFGSGSAAERQIIWDDVKEMIPSMPPVGRYKAVRNWLADRIGQEEADEYMPKIPDQTATSDEQIAIMENALLETASQIPVVPTALHAVQLPIHMHQLDGMRTALDNTPDLLPQLFGGFMATLEHATAHEQYLSNDPFYAQESGQYRKILQECQEIAHNGAEKLQNAQPENATGQNQQISPEVLKRLQENELKLKQSEEAHQQRMRQKEDAFRQEQAFRDARTAGEISRQPLAA